MRRLSGVRVIIAGLALLAAGAVPGCSSAPGPGRADSAGDAVRAAPAATARIGGGDGPARTQVPAADLIVTSAPSGVKAKEGVLADAATGQILWNRDMDTELPMASITKVMTAYLVISAGDLNRKVTVPKSVLAYEAKYGASSDDLEPGEVLTVHELLYGLLIPSGADAAYMLATVYGPGLNAFVAKMNATARQLGMLHTHFTSPDGLPYPTETSNYSTPADLLVLGETAMRSPVLRSIVDQHAYALPKGDGHHAHLWVNDNALIGTYPGAVGIKTGFTDVAMHCLLFEAVRSGRTLVGVVLGSPVTGPAAAAQDATQILNWGFSLSKVTSAKTGTTADPSPAASSASQGAG
jgi:serine-type D-Ala-D-Ala carboxypeptidase (penicillin-binding protein 5/6)